MSPALRRISGWCDGTFYAQTKITLLQPTQQPSRDSGESRHWPPCSLVARDGIPLLRRHGTRDAIPRYKGDSGEPRTGWRRVRDVERRAELC